MLHDCFCRNTSLWFYVSFAIVFVATLRCDFSTQTRYLGNESLDKGPNNTDNMIYKLPNPAFPCNNNPPQAQGLFFRKIFYLMGFLKRKFLLIKMESLGRVGVRWCLVRLPAH